MRTRTRFLALAMVATFAIAGCGEDNNDNDDNDNREPDRRRAPRRRGADRDGDARSPTVDRRRPRRPAVETPTPTPTPTSTAGVTGCLRRHRPDRHDHRARRLRSRHRLDRHRAQLGRDPRRRGHDQPRLPDGTNCTVDGTALVGTDVRLAAPALRGRRLVVRHQHVPRGRHRHLQLRRPAARESSVKLLSKVFLVHDAGQAVSALRRRPDAERRREGRHLRRRQDPGRGL